MNPAPNLFFIGPMGAGKTTIGRRVAGHLGLPFHDLDHEIEAHTGAAIPLIFELEGEAGFRQRESSVLAEFAAHDGIVLATGGGAVLAAENRERLRERGFVVYLEASLEDQLARLARDRKRPLLVAPDRRERLRDLAAVRNPLYRDTADLVVPASRHRNVVALSRQLAPDLARTWRRSDQAVATP
jgi:shikimate kinase